MPRRAAFLRCVALRFLLLMASGPRVANPSASTGKPVGGWVGWDKGEMGPRAQPVATCLLLPPIRRMSKHMPFQKSRRSIDVKFLWKSRAPIIKTLMFQPEKTRVIRWPPVSFTTSPDMLE